MPTLADRVWETSTTTGTGALALLGQESGYRNFVSALGGGVQTTFAIVHRTLPEWEVVTGTITDGTPDTISRTTVHAGSNGASLVNFSAGIKDVFCDIPASLVALLNNANTWTADQYILASLGIGTITPGASNGVAKMELYGNASSVLGPHWKCTTSSDAYPVFQGVMWSHDAIFLAFDSYYDGTNWKSSDAGSNFYLRKQLDAMLFGYASGVAVGSNITWVTGLTITLNGNVGVGVSNFGASAEHVLGITIGVEPTTSPANMIQLYAKDSSVGAANATLSVRTEQAVEAIGTFTPSHKLRIWVNGVEYHIQLDAV